MPVESLIRSDKVYLDARLALDCRKVGLNWLEREGRKEVVELNEGTAMEISQVLLLRVVVNVGKRWGVQKTGRVAMGRRRAANRGSTSVIE